MRSLNFTNMCSEYLRTGLAPSRVMVLATLVVTLKHDGVELESQGPANITSVDNVIDTWITRSKQAFATVETRSDTSDGASFLISLMTEDNSEGGRWSWLRPDGMLADNPKAAVWKWHPKLDPIRFGNQMAKTLLSYGQAHFDHKAGQESFCHTCPWQLRCLSDRTPYSA